MKKNAMTTMAYPPPPPPPSKGSRKTLIAVIVIVAIAAVAVGVYLATRSGGGGPSPSVTPTPTPSAAVTPTPTPTTTASPSATPTPTASSSGGGSNIAGATSVEFSADVSSGGTLQETYTYYVKNIGTSTTMFRIEGTGSQGDFIYIVNGAQQQVWVNENGEWTDLSASFANYWSSWNSAFTGYKNNLANWPGYGDWTYNNPDGTTVRIYDITVNPSLADSLFSHS
jgi:hypothetical protein